LQLAKSNAHNGRAAIELKIPAQSSILSKEDVEPATAADRIGNVIERSLLKPAAAKGEITSR
jgi:hypothetical protein